MVANIFQVAIDEGATGDKYIRNHQKPVRLILMANSSRLIFLKQTISLLNILWVLLIAINCRRQYFLSGKW